MSKRKHDPATREQDFIRYYSLSVYVLQVAKHCMNMAHGFTANSTIKNLLHKSETIVTSRIDTMLVNCNRQGAQDFRSDLAGEEVLALGAIMANLIDLDRIVAVESQMITLIRLLRKSEPGYIRMIKEMSNEIQVEPGTTTPILPDDLYYQYHSDVSRGECSRCFHLFTDTEPIIFVWPNAGEPHHGEPGEYRFCRPCMETAGVQFKLKTEQYEKEECGCNEAVG